MQRLRACFFFSAAHAAPPERLAPGAADADTDPPSPHNNAAQATSASGASARRMT
jgi:hypothetical protein